MRSPEVIYACRWLIRDTFRQALASRVVWVMLFACGIVIFFCLGISIEGGGTLRPTGDIAIDVPGVTKGRPGAFVYLAFGAWRLPLFRDGLAEVHFILLVLGEGVIGILGTLLALVLTAGFVPEFLQPGNATVLLSKPSPRWVLLLGKYLGVMALLTCYVSVFVIGTWLALGLKTGFWVNNFLWGVPLLVLHVAAMYGFSIFLGVLFGSTMVSVIGSVLFWFVCWGMNIGRHFLVALESQIPVQHTFLRFMVEAGYWILPKPVDLSMILHHAIDPSGQFLPQLEEAVQMGAFYPELSILSSLAFAVGMVFLAAHQLASKDY